jgi:hypothetical protein
MAFAWYNPDRQPNALGHARDLERLTDLLAQL